MKTRLCSLLFIFSLILVRCESDDCPECNGIIGQLPEAGLLAYYPFNNNASDESNNGHDGILHGAEFIKDRLNPVEGVAVDTTSIPNVYFTTDCSK